MAPAPAPTKAGGKKLLGLPLYVWLGAAAAGLLLGLYLRSRAKSAAANTSTAGGGTAVPVNLPTDQGNIATGAAGGGVAPASPGFDPATVAALLGGQFDDLTQLAAVGTEASVTNGANALSLASDAVNYLGAAVLNIPSSGGSGASVVGKVTQPAPAVLSPQKKVPVPAPVKVVAAAKPAKVAAPKPAPKAPAKPISGYSQKSTANLH